MELEKYDGLDLNLNLNLQLGVFLIELVKDLMFFFSGGLICQFQGFVINVMGWEKFWWIRLCRLVINIFISLNFVLRFCLYFKIVCLK